MDEVTLEFDAGLNVITGETGAGKSMIVGSLALLLGARADADVVRRGHDQAEIEARFVVPDTLRPRLDEAGLPVEEEIVLSRRIRKGTSKAWMNGRMATVGQLADVGEFLVELVGQHHARSLTRPSAQRVSLDRYSGDTAEKARRCVEDLWDTCRGLERELHTLGDDPAARVREAEMLTRQITEIRAVDPGPGDEGLAEELRRLRNAGSLREDIMSARAAVDSARDLLAEAADRLERSGDPRLHEILGTLNASMAEAEAATDDLRDNLERIVDDPERLDELQRRHIAIRDLQRKYGADIPGILDFAQEAASRLSRLEHAERRAEEIRDALDEANEELARAAGLLSRTRKSAARRLAKAVTSRIGTLALPGAAVGVEIRPLGRVERHGGDEVLFVFSASSDLEPRPLGKVASGGELSRLVLALASEIADLDAPPTIVFDEVDAGTGGEAATAVGLTLAAQARNRQLLCVTHLAQVAAHADNHIVVRKTAGTATAESVTGTARIVELSRMLSGSPDSGRARDHAQELLERAQLAKRN